MLWYILHSSTCTVKCHCLHSSVTYSLTRETEVEIWNQSTNLTVEVGLRITYSNQCMQCWGTSLQFASRIESKAHLNYTVYVTRRYCAVPTTHILYLISTGSFLQATAHLFSHSINCIAPITLQTPKTLCVRAARTCFIHVTKILSVSQYLWPTFHIFPTHKIVVNARRD